MFPLLKRLVFITILPCFPLLIVKGTELTQERWYCFSENHGDLGKQKWNHQTDGCGFRLSLCLSLAYHDFWSHLDSTIQTLPTKSLNIFSLNKKNRVDDSNLKSIDLLASENSTHIPNWGRLEQNFGWYPQRNPQTYNFSRPEVSDLGKTVEGMMCSLKYLVHYVWGWSMGLGMQGHQQQQKHKWTWRTSHWVSRSLTSKLLNAIFRYFSPAMRWMSCYNLPLLFWRQSNHPYHPVSLSN